MFTNTPSDRVQVRQLGDLPHPAACALCGNGTHEEGFVDTGVYYEYEGEVLFCMSCARQIAECFGCLLPEEADRLREEAGIISSLNETLKAENDDLRNKLAVWDSVINDAVDRGVLSSNAEQGESSSHQDVKVPVSGPGSRKSSATKSASKQGPHDAAQSERSNIVL